MESDLSTLDFSSSYSDNFPKILSHLGISLAVTSYQSQRLILVRSRGEKLETKLKAFPRPMGLYADENRITLGTLNKVIDFRRADNVHKSVQNGELDRYDELPKKLKDKELEENTEYSQERVEQIDSVKASDALFVERATLSTGMINIHDIGWGADGLWVVNSVFSCLCKLSPDYSFVTAWQPSFISELKPENRCHLNGMAMLNGYPRYATAFSESNNVEGWRDNLGNEGVLIDINENRVVKSGISMPHSPRCHDGKVYYCASGEGEIHEYNPVTKETSVLCELPGFTRGMTFFGDLMVVGTSTLRKSEDEIRFDANPRLLGGKSECAIWLIDTSTGDVVANVTFSGDVKQLYDIAIIPNSISPEVLQSSDALASHLFEFYSE